MGMRGNGRAILSLLIVQHATLQVNKITLIRQMIENTSMVNVFPLPLLVFVCYTNNFKPPHIKNYLCITSLNVLIWVSKGFFLFCREKSENMATFIFTKNSELLK